MINSIEKSKANELSQLISALGIRHVGAKAAKTIAKYFKDIEKIEKATKEELINIDDVGEITAESIYNFFKTKQNIEQVEKLKKASVNMKEKSKSIDSRFKNQIFVITGALEKYTRDEATEIIENFEGKVSSSVSKNTTYLLAGENTRK